MHPTERKRNFVYWVKKSHKQCQQQSDYITGTQRPPHGSNPSVAASHCVKILVLEAEYLSDVGDADWADAAKEAEITPRRWAEADEQANIM